MVFVVHLTIRSIRNLSWHCVSGTIDKVKTASIKSSSTSRLTCVVICSTQVLDLKSNATGKRKKKEQRKITLISVVLAISSTNYVMVAQYLVSCHRFWCTFLWRGSYNVMSWNLKSYETNNMHKFKWITLKGGLFKFGWKVKSSHLQNAFITSIIHISYGISARNWFSNICEQNWHFVVYVGLFSSQLT